MLISLRRALSSSSVRTISHLLSGPNFSLHVLKQRSEELAVINMRNPIYLVLFISSLTHFTVTASSVVGPPSARPSLEELEEINRLLISKGKTPVAITDILTDVHKDILPPSARPSTSDAPSPSTPLPESTTTMTTTTTSTSITDEADGIMEFDPINEMTSEEEDRFLKKLGLHRFPIREFGSKTVNADNEHSAIHNLDGFNPVLPAFAFSSDENEIEVINKPDDDIVSKITKELIEEKKQKYSNTNNDEFIEYDQDYEILDVEKVPHSFKSSTMPSTTTTATSTTRRTTATSFSTVPTSRPTTTVPTPTPTTTVRTTTSPTTSTSAIATRPSHEITEQYDKVSQFKTGTNYIPLRLVYNKPAEEIFHPTAKPVILIPTLPPNIVTAKPVGLLDALRSNQNKENSPKDSEWESKAKEMSLMTRTTGLPLVRPSIPFSSTSKQAAQTTEIPRTSKLPNIASPMANSIVSSTTHLMMNNQPRSSNHHQLGFSNQVFGDTADKVEPKKSSGRMVFRRLFKVKKTKEQVRDNEALTHKFSPVPPPVIIPRRHRIFSPTSFISSPDNLQFLKAIPPSPAQSLAELPSFSTITSNEPFTDDLQLNEQGKKRVGSRSFLKNGQTVESIPRILSVRPAEQTPLPLISKSSPQIVRTNDVEAAEENFARSLLKSNADPIQMVVEGLRELKRRTKMMQRAMKAKAVRAHASQVLSRTAGVERIDNATDNNKLTLNDLTANSQRLERRDHVIYRDV
ncbi:unnamed protein product [Auanema sp. JU1783]|nr:unnamed protein product [Auanema sp. JU1783]